ncbi:hypothetical protein [Kingella negevensis]|uniref:hypothetical protein n=1 Tax=Kingella negevensis TaxID=1522312 RepID=UPI00050A31BA|nr:hypothetical protein [Kingella negevensis]MDK4684780.1 hypothetical protein [Kingella negevensis]MDK4688693.1 hypothetical protein [Kingella negevensis]MDK4707321.1 hypothetical protein [Kingella negevensis]MDK4710201.1 hypothetical protein [Kingella negevensis]WII91564.1 hypothetical protein QEO93_02975 [Kingella negevensis]
MSKRTIALAVACCFLFSGCQVIEESRMVTKFGEIWKTVGHKVSEEDQAFLSDFSKQDTPNKTDPEKDKNYLKTSSDDAGNREYLLKDSVQKDEIGTVTATIEYFYAKPQTLPETSAIYTHNRWFEQIDCTHSLRTVRMTTYFNAENDVVGANEYPVPKYTPEQIELLAQPNDDVVREVCKQVGTLNAAANNPKADEITKPETASQTVSQPEKVSEKVADKVSEKVEMQPEKSADEVSKETQSQPEKVVDKVSETVETQPEKATDKVSKKTKSQPKKSAAKVSEETQSQPETQPSQTVQQPNTDNWKINTPSSGKP